MLPSPDTPITFEKSPSGYKLGYKMQTFDIEMVLAPDMRLLSASVKAPPVRPLRDHIRERSAGISFDLIDHG